MISFILGNEIFLAVVFSDFQRLFTTLGTCLGVIRRLRRFRSIILSESDFHHASSECINQYFTSLRPIRCNFLPAINHTLKAFVSVYNGSSK
jgi:hypothetical protein